MSLTLQDDYGTRTAPDTVRLERLLPATAERVWEYLTDPKLRARWLADGAMELCPAGAVEHVFRNAELTQGDDPAPPKYAGVEKWARMQGRITACEPPHLLAYTWGEDSGDPSEVRFELSERRDQVLLVVTHRRLGRDAMLSVAAGWHTHLAILRARLEGAEAPGFWRTHTRLEAEYAQRFSAG